MKTYNIGVVGYGGFGKFLNYWWSKMDGIKICTIAVIVFSNKKLKPQKMKEDDLKSQLMGSLNAKERA